MAENSSTRLQTEARALGGGRNVGARDGKRKAPADDGNETRARKRREDPVGTEKEAIRAQPGPERRGK